MRRGSGSRKVNILTGKPFRNSRNESRPAIPTYSSVPGQSLRSQGKDNPFTLEIEYNWKVEQTDASGYYAGASGAYFDPTNLPGWSALKTLFKEFRLVYYAIKITPNQGVDQTGYVCFRKSNDPTETVQASYELERELGATEHMLSNTKNLIIPCMPDTAEEADWHPIDETTDSNNYGYNKEYGQIFGRGESSVSQKIFTFVEIARVVFRGFKF
jgi:hypothetical protein